MMVWARAALLVWLLAVLPHAGAYVFMGSKWPKPQTTFYVDIAGASGAWNTAFEDAMTSWAVAGFDFNVVRNSYSDPCVASDHRNGVRFHTHFCGTAFGASTLAITSYMYVGSETVEADIVFNANESWNVYTGALNYGSMDFQRVAVHELGHALGLGHENANHTIMTSVIGNVEVPQADDIAGVRSLYGLTGDDYGNSIGTAQAIASVSITGGVIGTGSDVDFFSIQVSSRGRLSLRTQGGTDTVGTLYSASGTVILSNDDGCGSETNFCLNRILSPGTYYLKVDGYGTQVTGPYSLIARFAVDDYGNTREEAKLIAPNSTTSGQINSGSDIDYFKIKLTRSGRLSLHTKGTTDTLGALYSSGGSRLALNDDGCGSTVNFCFTRTLAAGNYYLKVDGYGTTVTGPYTLIAIFK